MNNLTFKLVSVIQSEIFGFADNISVDGNISITKFKQEWIKLYGTGEIYNEQASEKISENSICEMAKQEKKHCLLILKV